MTQRKEPQPEFRDINAVPIIGGTLLPDVPADIIDRTLTIETHDDGTQTVELSAGEHGGDVIGIGKNIDGVKNEVRGQVLRVLDHDFRILGVPTPRSEFSLAVKFLRRRRPLPEVETSLIDGRLLIAHNQHDLGFRIHHEGGDVIGIHVAIIDSMWPGKLLWDGNTRLRIIDFNYRVLGKAANRDDALIARFLYQGDPETTLPPQQTLLGLPIVYTDNFWIHRWSWFATDKERNDRWQRTIDTSG